MKLILGGKSLPQDTLKIFKAADALAIPLRVLDDTGAPINLTGHTVTLECYASPLRSAAAVKTLSTTVVDATAGAHQLLPVVSSIDFGPGTYYVYAKTDNAGAISISQNYITLKVG